MRRSSPMAIGLLIFLPLASGVIWFLWSLLAFGDQCGWRLPGFAGGPSRTGTVVLIALPPVIVIVVQAVQTRSWRRVLGFGILAALLSALAVFVAFITWIISRHCGE